MSTELESLQEKIKGELANLRNTVAPPSSNRITTRDKKFNLPDGTVLNQLEAVILDHRNFNRYYTKAYDPQNPTPPACFAIAKNLEELSPHNHDDVPEPQADSCSVCPMNEFGSASTGKGKACRNMVRLALAPPDATDDTEPMTLEVPPSAINKHWNKYVNNLSTTGVLPIQVVTAIQFDSSVAYPCPTFAYSEAHDRLELFWQLREKAQTVLDQTPATT